MIGKFINTSPEHFNYCKIFIVSSIFITFDRRLIGLNLYETPLGCMQLKPLRTNHFCRPNHEYFIGSKEFINSNLSIILKSDLC